MSYKIIKRDIKSDLSYFIKSGHMITILATIEVVEYRSQ